MFFHFEGYTKRTEFFFNGINKKHLSIKFDKKYSKSQIEFLNILVYKDEQQRSQKTLFKKKTDRQSYLHAKSHRQVSLKKNIPNSQILQVKGICSKNNKIMRNCNVLQKQLTKKVF